MRLATIWVDGREQLAICQEAGFVPIAEINREFECQWPQTMQQLIETGLLAQLKDWYSRQGRRKLDSSRHLVLNRRQGSFAPPYRYPPKIWGIGLNYREHARDLSESPPTSAPASFMKPYTTIIGPGETIEIPQLSNRIRRTAHRADLHSDTISGISK